MKKLLTIFFLLFFCRLTAEAAPDSTINVPVTIQGLVKDSASGSGISNYKVYFVTDSLSTINIFDSTLTNSSGFYFDTLWVPSNLMYTLQIYTYDCNSQVHAAIVGSPLYNFIQNFTICYSPPLYNLGGQVFGSFFPLSAGQVILYKPASPEYLALDTATLNPNGVYYFYQVPGGDYVIKAFAPESPSSTTYFPAYSQASLLWQSASMIHLNQNLFNADISLSVVPNAIMGAASVSGNVSLGSATSPFPLAYVEVLLFDSLMQAIDYRIAGPDGAYAFQGISPGLHYLKVEIPGRFLEAQAFQAGNGFPDAALVDLVVPDNVIGISEPELISQVSQAFPNPASSECNICVVRKTPAMAHIQLIDLSGRILRQVEQRFVMGSNTLKIPLQTLNPGLYFIRIRVDGALPALRKIQVFRL
ncbi:MAG: T9SS type A sorting domain-containing protein [Bacteroidota bacterium]